MKNIVIKTPELVLNRCDVLTHGSHRLSTLAGARIPTNASRTGRTGASDERRLAGDVPNRFATAKRK